MPDESRVLARVPLLAPAGRSANGVVEPLEQQGQAVER